MSYPVGVSLARAKQMLNKTSLINDVDNLKFLGSVLPEEEGASYVEVKVVRVQKPPAEAVVFTIRVDAPYDMPDIPQPWESVRLEGQQQAFDPAGKPYFLVNLSSEQMDLAGVPYIGDPPSRLHSPRLVRRGRLPAGGDLEEDGPGEPEQDQEDAEDNIPAQENEDAEMLGGESDDGNQGAEVLDDSTEVEAEAEEDDSEGEATSDENSPPPETHEVERWHKIPQVSGRTVTRTLATKGSPKLFFSAVIRIGNRSSLTDLVRLFITNLPADVALAEVGWEQNVQVVQARALLSVFGGGEITGKLIKNRKLP